MLVSRDFKALSTADAAELCRWARNARSDHSLDLVADRSPTVVALQPQLGICTDGHAGCDRAHRGPAGRVRGHLTVRARTSRRRANLPLPRHCF